MNVRAPEFEIDVTGGLTWARVSVSGEIDLSTAGELEWALSEEMRRRRPVVLDLGRVEFVDSTGLTVIVRALQDAQSNGWDFSVAANLPPAVERTARIAGILPMLPLVDED